MSTKLKFILLLVLAMGFADLAAQKTGEEWDSEGWEYEYRQNNFVEAAKCYKKSAELGYAKGQYHIAVCYGLGIGVEKNLRESFKWHNAAIKQGFHPSYNEIAYFYFNGWIVPRNTVKALECINKAIQLSSPGDESMAPMQYLDTKGEFLSKLGRKSEALKMKKLIDETGVTTSALLHEETAFYKKLLEWEKQGTRVHFPFKTISFSTKGSSGNPRAFSIEIYNNTYTGIRTIKKFLPGKSSAVLTAKTGKFDDIYKPVNNSNLSKITVKSQYTDYKEWYADGGCTEYEYLGEGKAPAAEFQKKLAQKVVKSYYPTYVKNSDGTTTPVTNQYYAGYVEFYNNKAYIIMDGDRYNYSKTVGTDHYYYPASNGYKAVIFSSDFTQMAYKALEFQLMGATFTTYVFNSYLGEGKEFAMAYKQRQINSGSGGYNPNGGGYNSNGNSSAAQRPEKCGLCLGNGKCIKCNGTRKVINSYTGQYMICSTCNGTGVCHHCNGTGRCTCSPSTQQRTGCGLLRMRSSYQ